MQTMIGPNPNTTANAKTQLWNAARKGKASAAGKVRRMKAAGTWTDAAALDMLAALDAAISTTEPLTADHYQLAAQRAYIVAASA